MSNYILFDLHEDITYYLINYGIDDFDKDIENRQVDIPKMYRANIKFIVNAIFTLSKTYNPKISKFLTEMYGMEVVEAFETSYENLWRGLKVNYLLIDRYCNTFRLVFNVNDINEILNSNKIGLIIGIEGLNSINDFSDLILLNKLGVKVLGLTWNFDNKFASSCMSKKDYGLTTLGEEIVKEANRLGMIIDLAHSSKQTMIDVLKISKKPVIISHANIRKVFNHVRNVDDEVLELLKKNRGVIGITFITSTIGKEATIENIIKHIMYVYECFGIEIIGIGTDYLGIRNTPKNLESIDKITILFKELEKYLSKEEIECITYKNALRVFKENMQ